MSTLDPQTTEPVEPEPEPDDDADSEGGESA